MPQGRLLPTCSTISIPRFSSFSRIRAQFHSPRGLSQSKIFSGFTHIQHWIVEFVGRALHLVKHNFLDNSLRYLAVFAPLQSHRLGSIKYTQQRQATPAGQVLRQRSYQSFHALVLHQSDAHPAGVLQPRGEEMDACAGVCHSRTRRLLAQNRAD